MIQKKKCQLLTKFAFTDIEKTDIDALANELQDDDPKFSSFLKATLTAEGSGHNSASSLLRHEFVSDGAGTVEFDGHEQGKKGKIHQELVAMKSEHANEMQRLESKLARPVNKGLKREKTDIGALANELQDDDLKLLSLRKASLTADGSKCKSASSLLRHEFIADGLRTVGFVSHEQGIGKMHQELAAMKSEHGKEMQRLESEMAQQVNVGLKREVRLQEQVENCQSEVQKMNSLAMLKLSEMESKHRFEMKQLSDEKDRETNKIRQEVSKMAERFAQMELEFEKKQLDKSTQTETWKQRDATRKQPTTAEQKVATNQRQRSRKGIINQLVLLT